MKTFEDAALCYGYGCGILCGTFLTSVFEGLAGQVIGGIVCIVMAFGIAGRATR